MIELPFLESVGKVFIPKKVRPGLKDYLQKAGYQDVPYSFFGMIFFLVLIIFYLIFVIFILPMSKGKSLAVSGALYFFSAAGVLFILSAAAMLILQLYFSIKIYDRTKELERVLPEYLVLVSTNLKGGMSFEQALWDAIKPEFGVLAREIGLVSKKVMTGNDVKDALEEFINKYDSPILRRNFQLIISEYQSGGKIVKIIDKIIENLRKSQVLKKELIASTTTYMIFIGSLVTVISPALFALSYQLFFLIVSFMGSISGSAASISGTLSVSTPKVDPSDFRAFSILAIILISIGASAILSIIEKGSLRGMMKYVPLFLIISLIVYFIASAALSGIFASMTGVLQ